MSFSRKGTGLSIVMSVGKEREEVGKELTSNTCYLWRSLHMFLHFDPDENPWGTHPCTWFIDKGTQDSEKSCNLSTTRAQEAELGCELWSACSFSDTNPGATVKGVSRKPKYAWREWNFAVYRNNGISQERWVVFKAPET